MQRVLNLPKLINKICGDLGTKILSYELTVTGFSEKSKSTSKLTQTIFPTPDTKVSLLHLCILIIEKMPHNYLFKDMTKK